MTPPADPAVRPEPHTVRAADGRLLVGDLWRAQEPRGAVVVRTPYDARAHAALGRGWAARGYDCLVQDVRGRHRSEGDWDPYRHEGLDGASTLEAVRRDRPGLPTLLYGASYAAHTALTAAAAAVASGAPAPDGVVVMVPALGLAETARDPDGTPRLRQRIGWWHEHGVDRGSRPPLPAAELADRVRLARRIGPVAAAERWGWPTPVQRRGRGLWAAERIDVAALVAPLRGPLLTVTGDDDVFDDDARALAAAWPGPSTLLTGPWGHDLGRHSAPADARTALHATGGLGGRIEAWLREHELPGPATDRAAAARTTAGTRWRLDPARAAWVPETATARRRPTPGRTPAA